MQRFIRHAVAVAIALCSTGAVAATLGPNPLPASNLPGPAAPTGVCGPVLLTQTTSQVPAASNTISCNATGLHAENSYYREYASAALPTGFNVCAVELAIENANAGDPATSQPLTINLYRQTGGAFPGGTRTVIGTATVQVPDGGLGNFTVPVTGAVAAGESLVVEALEPNGQAAGHSLFLGSNAAGQSAPTFIRAPDCGLAAPADMATIGFPNVHIILNARGTAGVPAAITVTPATVQFGNVTVGGNATLTATITNSGGAALNISAIAAPTAPFTQTATTCIGSAIPAAGTCTVTYRYAPTAAGPSTQTLAITSNAAAANIVLAGTGVAAAISVPGPGPLALLFGALCLVVAGGFYLRRRAS